MRTSAQSPHRLFGLAIAGALLFALPSCRPGAAPARTGLGCPAGIGAAAQDGAQAARCMYQAWEEGNRSKAADFASLDAVDALFGRSWSAPGGVFQGCSGEADARIQVCRFERRRAMYRFVVRPSEGGWRVTQVQVPAVER